MQGAKSLKAAGKTLLKQLGFDRFRITRKGKYFKLEGHINPWVLLASGEVKHIDEDVAKGKKIGDNIEVDGIRGEIIDKNHFKASGNLMLKEKGGKKNALQKEKSNFGKNLQPTGDFSPKGTIQKRGRNRFEQSEDIAPAKLKFGAVKKIRIKEIKFMQNSISNPTGDFWVLENAMVLKNGGTLPASNIKVWYNTAKGLEGFWTVDHRRLAAYKLAGRKNINVEYIKPSELMAKNTFKMTTQTKGVGMEIRVGLKDGKFVNPKKLPKGAEFKIETWKLIENTDGSMIIKNAKGNIINLDDITKYVADGK